MRKALRKEGVGYLVTRKTLAKIALNNAGIEGTMPEFVGELAIVYGEDLTTPAREFYAFQKKYNGNVKIVGGILKGSILTVEEMTAIAAIHRRKRSTRSSSISSIRRYRDLQSYWTQSQRQRQYKLLFIN